MASNSLQRTSASSTVVAVERILAGIAASTPAAYGLTAAQVSTLGNAKDQLAAANTSVTDAKAAYHAAVQDREAKDRACVGVEATIVRLVYADPSVTPSMIADLGLSPRSTSRAKIVPTTPAGLAVFLQSNGDVQLKWERGANPQGVVFVVEASVDGGAWTFAGQTTAAKITLAGYAPGGSLAFRAYASKNGIDSPYSLVVNAYSAPTPAPALRIAA